jgi:urease accessory protein
MLAVREILGAASEPRFAGRRIEQLTVNASEAARPRLRRSTDAGTDVAVDLPRGSYLRHGAVLVDDGERIVVVERTAEETLVVRLSFSLPPEELLRQAVALGHAFGNQHVPVEVANREVRVPVTTSRELALDTVRGLGLTGVETSFADVRLGCDRPLDCAARHAHP